jgi:hypothetical protein
MLCKIEQFSSVDCRIINSHESQEAFSQTGRCGGLSDLRRRAGQEVRTDLGKVPNNAAS